MATLTKPILLNEISAYAVWEADGQLNSRYELNCVLPNIASLSNIATIRITDAQGIVTTVKKIISQNLLPEVTTIGYNTNRYCVVLDNCLPTNINSYCKIAMQISDINNNVSNFTSAIVLHPVYIDKENPLTILSGVPMPTLESYTLQAILHTTHEDEDDFINWYKIIVQQNIGTNTESNWQTIYTTPNKIYPARTGDFQNQIYFTFNDSTFSFFNRYNEVLQVCILISTHKGYLTTDTFQYYEAAAASYARLLATNADAPSVTSQGHLGAIQVRYQGAFDIDGALRLERYSQVDNFNNPTILYTENYTANTPIDINFLDKAAESGYRYKYTVSVQSEAAKTESARSDAVYFILDDMLLMTKDRTLCIKFNPKVTNFKYVVGDSITQTLGATYPFIRRNGDMEYRQFTLGGLISIEADPLDGTGFLALNEISLLPTEITISENRTCDFIREKNYRDKILDFLYANDIKLFKSQSEGNILVYLSNISLTPNEQLGRLIYTFQAQATEVKRPTIASYQALGLLSPGAVAETSYYNLYHLNGETLNGDDAEAVIETTSVDEDSLVIEQSQITF